MTIKEFNGGTLVTGPGIRLYQFLARKHALKLEIFGMKRRGASVYSICKKEYGLKGNKKSVLEQMEKAEVNTDTGEVVFPTEG